MGYNLLNLQNGTDNAILQGAVEVMREESPVLDAMFFMDVDGAGVKYAVSDQNNPSTVALRGRNEGYTAQEGKTRPVFENTTIIGGRAEVDVAVLADNGVRPDNVERVAAFLQAESNKKVRSTVREFHRMFIKGDPATNVRELKGLQARATGNQLLFCQNAANGAELLETELLRLKQAVKGATHYIGSDEMLRQITNKLNNTSSIQRTKDDFGREVTIIAGLPYIELDEDQSGTKILQFNETRGTSSVTGSLYCVALGRRDMEKLVGFENRPMQADPPYKKDDGITIAQLFEWQMGIASYGDEQRDFARLAGILKASGVI